MRSCNAAGCLRGLAAEAFHGQAATPPTVSCFTHSVFAVSFPLHRCRRQASDAMGTGTHGAAVVQPFAAMHSFISRAIWCLNPRQKVLLAFNLTGHWRL
jgi:hypothetical protein